MAATEPVERGRLVGAQTYTRVPTVVVDDLHIVYRVPASGTTSRGKQPGRRTSRTAMREVHAIKGVSFAAYEGDAIGLIGSNGSGKSTLLRAVAGLMKPTRGAVYTRQQPTLLGVNAVLMNDLPGEWNVMLGLLAMGMTRGEARKQVADIIEFSGINEKGDFSSLPMRTYSSGMSARLRFAIAAAKTHDILLIDEALATGDAKFKTRSAERVQELRAGAGTVFLVSHDSGAIRTSCERAIWLESGVIRMDGPSDEVVDAYEEFANQGAAKPQPASAMPQPAPAKPVPAPKPTPAPAAAEPPPAAPPAPAPPVVPAPPAVPAPPIMPAALPEPSNSGRHRAD